MIWILRDILAKNVDFAQFVRYCKYKEEKQGRRRELTMWKKHKHLFLFPAAVLGILAVCWISELMELLRERKKEKEEP